MKIIKLLFAVVIISNSVKAQVDCLPSGHFAYLDINNVKARITSGSSLWQDLSTGSAAYEFPAGSGETVIYAGNFGIGGLDGSNNLHFSGATFENSTFFPGPIRIATATTEGISCAAF